jgi:16S rRNA (uracil1498-N3)-methyltransferase
MNIVLFAPSEIESPLPTSDPRATHIIKVLRRKVGDLFDVGLINGPRGKAKLTSVEPTSLGLDYAWDSPHPAPPSTTLVVGLPRPQTARDILRDATTLGATALHFVSTARTDPNYASSSLWTSGEWNRHLTTGAAQAFETHVPAVSFHHSLAEILSLPVGRAAQIIALDIYEAASPLAHFSVHTSTTPVTILIGPERGWASPDRSLLAVNNIPLYHLGERVLRTETAVTAAMVLVNASRTRA